MSDSNFKLAVFIILVLFSNNFYIRLFSICGFTIVIYMVVITTCIENFKNKAIKWSGLKNPKLGLDGMIHMTNEIKTDLKKIQSMDEDISDNDLDTLSTDTLIDDYIEKKDETL